MKIVSASDANRQFSSLLKQASQGAVITITSHGKPVAMITPAGVDPHARHAARKRLIERLRHQEATGARTWGRDELYE